MESMNEDQIKHILNLYKCQREKDKEKYQKRKLDPVFMESNRTRSRNHYSKNKDQKKEGYVNNCELHKAKCSYHYYVKNQKIDKFKERFPERYELLNSINYIKE
tara:strand:+ start:251 stop:562 length:312 start_codon:yes stop_codon:yes gene_type:complete